MATKLQADRVKNVHGHTLDLLGEAIVAGRYAPGAAIPPEPTLCEELGVSRTVVREAVKSLVAKGLLVTGPKVGTRVLPSKGWNWFDPDVVAWQTEAGPTLEFLRDLQEMRRVVEPAAVRLAAARATAQEIAVVEEAYEGMRRAIAGEGDYVVQDLAFHRALIGACHNRMLQQMGKTLEALLRTSFRISTARPNGPALSLPLHREILDAVIARAPDLAERACLRLIDGAGRDIESVLGAPGLAEADGAGLSRSGRAAGTPSAPSARAGGSPPRPTPPTEARRSPLP
jgi:DNA-binding FadR family transcriptional regulator